MNVSHETSPRETVTDAEGTTGSVTTIAGNLAAVRGRIEAATARAGRPKGSVRLIAVTKRVDATRVAQAVRAGATDLGENYVQEAQGKIPQVAELRGNDGPTPTWHLIGSLQKNKARNSVAQFALLHTVDSLSLAQEINKQALKIGKIQPILIEVRLGEGDGRAGVAVGDTLALAEQVATLPGLALRGLMGVPPPTETADGATPHFERLRGLWDDLPPANRHELSMGMSSDFEQAIVCGATMVRVGTAIFGARQ